MSTTTFFKLPLAKPSGSVYIDVDGKLLHALATELVDCFYFNNSGPYPEEFKKIGEQFKKSFPDYISYRADLKPEEIVAQLNINFRGRRSDYIECMSIVLNEIMNDKLFAQPTEFRQAYAGLTPETPKNYFTQVNRQLHPCVLDALEQALGLNITLSFVEHGNELRYRDRNSKAYNGTHKFNVELLVQDNHYFPLVKDIADYAHVKLPSKTAPKPIIDEQKYTGTMRDNLTLIAQADLKLKTDRNQKRRNLSSMHLTEEILLDVFSTFYPVNRARTTLSTSYLDKQEPSDKSPAKFDPKSQSYKLETLLTNTITDWIVTKLVDEDMVYDWIENNKAPTLSR